MEYSTSVSQQQELQTDRQRPYSTSQQHSDGNWSFTNVLNIEENKGTTSRTIGEAKNPMKFIPEPLFIILGSTYCLIILCILLVVPILELAIGAAYRNQCTINSNIPVYLIVTGACGIASIVLTMAIVGAFICCFKQESAPGSIAIGCVIGVIFLFLFLMGLFLFIWFIVGNVWIFGAKKNVVYNDTTSPNYCHRTLYDFAFTILIISYIMAVISCCSSCFRSCLQVVTATKS